MKYEEELCWVSFIYKNCKFLYSIEMTIRKEFEQDTDAGNSLKYARDNQRDRLCTHRGNYNSTFPHTLLHYLLRYPSPSSFQQLIIWGKLKTERSKTERGSKGPALTS
jgi:hypothetical protein